MFVKPCSTSNSVPDGEPYPQVKDLKISTEGVCKLLKDIKINNAMGQDFIPNMLLKELAEESTCLLQSLHTGSLGWSIALSLVKCKHKPPCSKKATDTYLLTRDPYLSLASPASYLNILFVNIS